MRGDRTSGPFVAGLIVVIAASNLVSNRLLPRALYVPWNLGVAAGLIAVALTLGGLSRAEIGLAREDVGRGARWGFAAWGIVLAVLLIGVAVPGTRELFEDRRVAATGALAVGYEVLVRIPLGTAVPEEVIFRGVLLGVFARRVGTWPAAALSSVLFGLWHVLPAWNIDDANPVFERWLGGGAGQVVAITVAVVGTAAVGLVFCWLRIRSRSLLAPVLAHCATNTTGYVLAWLVQR